MDACTLLDEATVRKITGESVGFTTQDLTYGSQLQCFWGAVVPNVSACVDLGVSPRDRIWSPTTWPKRWRR